MVFKKVEYLEFLNISKEIIESEEYLLLKSFIHHKKISCYDHSINVAYYSYLFGKKHKLDYQSMTRGALLHDYYLYDWHDKNKGFRFHGFKHPKISLNNAIKKYHLNKKEKDIIKNHMFPLTLFSFPKSIESIVVSLIDKKVSLLEYFNKRIEVVIID